MVYAADGVAALAVHRQGEVASALLHGRILRSPHAHAKIRNIDTSAAAK